MSKLPLVKFFAILLASLMLTACISATPVETQSTVDDRPLLFFTTEGSPDPAQKLGIYVDGLYMGDAGQFINTRKGLAILPGTHIVEVRSNGVSLLNEKIYIGSGTNKTLAIAIK